MTAVATTITGFTAAGNRPYECPIADIGAPARNALAGLPVSLASRPIFNLLAGIADWDATKRHIQNHSTARNKNGAAAVEQIRLVVPDIDNPGLAFALKADAKGKAVAAISLGAKSDGWDAEPLALFTDNIAQCPALTFYSPSVRALLDLSDVCFHRVLQPVREAAARLAYVQMGGTQFKPDCPHARLWAIASRWPEWQRRRLGFPARKLELGFLDNTDDDAYLRQTCSRQLSLKISETTDN